MDTHARLHRRKLCGLHSLLHTTLGGNRTSSVQKKLWHFSGRPAFPLHTAIRPVVYNFHRLSLEFVHWAICGSGREKRATNCPGIHKTLGYPYACRFSNKRLYVYFSLSFSSRVSLMLPYIRVLIEWVFI